MDQPHLHVVKHILQGRAPPSRRPHLRADSRIWCRMFSPALSSRELTSAIFMGNLLIHRRELRHTGQVLPPVLREDTGQSSWPVPPLPRASCISLPLRYPRCRGRRPGRPVLRAIAISPRVPWLPPIAVTASPDWATTTFLACPAIRMHHNPEVQVPLTRPREDARRSIPPCSPGSFAGRLHHPAQAPADEDATALCNEGACSIRCLVLRIRCNRCPCNRDLHARTLPAREKNLRGFPVPGTFLQKRMAQFILYGENRETDYISTGNCCAAIRHDIHFMRR